MGDRINPNPEADRLARAANPTTGAKLRSEAERQQRESAAQSLRDAEDHARRIHEGTLATARDFKRTARRA